MHWRRSGALVLSEVHSGRDERRQGQRETHDDDNNGACERQTRCDRLVPCGAHVPVLVPLLSAQMPPHAHTSRLTDNQYLIRSMASSRVCVCLFVGVSSGDMLYVCSGAPFAGIVFK